MLSMRRLLALSALAALLVAACASGRNPDDEPSATDGGGKDGSLGDGSRPDGGGLDTGPGCDKCGGATCVDLQTDKANCKSCGNACSDACCAGACADTATDDANCGACGSPCTGGNSCCNSSCVDTKTDLANCGSCGVPCNGTCAGGKCTVACTVDLGSCAHSPCVTGTALTDICDVDGCTDLVCNYIDPNCCSSAWNAACVQDAIVWCGENCNGC